MTQTDIPISRLACTFAFDDLGAAKEYRSVGAHIYSVQPLDRAASNLRLDMLWLTWMGEPGRRPEQVVNDCGSYWAGASIGDVAQHVTPTWERLFRCGLVVLGQVE